MTREEQINTLTAIIQECEEYQWQRKETLYEIINLLEQEPCEDAISREEVINCFTWTNTKDDVWYAVKALPSVYPKQKTGHWIESKDERGCIKLTCSCCGYRSAINSGGNFCKDCGARMVESQESEGE